MPYWSASMVYAWTSSFFFSSWMIVSSRSLASGPVWIYRLKWLDCVPGTRWVRAATAMALSRANSAIATWLMLVLRQSFLISPYLEEELKPLRLDSSPDSSLGSSWMFLVCEFVIMPICGRAVPYEGVWQVGQFVNVPCSRH